MSTPDDSRFYRRLEPRNEQLESELAALRAERDEARGRYEWLKDVCLYWKNDAVYVYEFTGAIARGRLIDSAIDSERTKRATESAGGGR
jgi:hypothetical protein